LFEYPGRVRQFYATEPGACPYLAGRTEQRIVTPLEPGDGPGDLDALTEAGFRRSQSWLYKPACPACRACVSVRIVAARFVPDRTQRRIARRNADLVATPRPAVITDEQYALFSRYIAARHGDGGMAGMSREEFRAMVERSGPATMLVELRRGADGPLLAVSLTDRVRSGFSGVYKFFEPDESKRSLGTAVILWHIAEARRHGLPYVYLGFWIAGSAKMAYKTRFSALERLDGLSWRPFAAAEGG
jgi:arginyl-tRNA--protein-N-Asp/Glu arginylyltransferase